MTDSEAQVSPPEMALRLFKKKIKGVGSLCLEGRKAARPHREFSMRAVIRESAEVQPASNG